MNKLINQRCYLAGAMDRVIDRGVGWRDYITPILAGYGVQVLNPVHKPIGAGAETDDVVLKKKLLKQKGSFDELSALMKEIRSIDLRMVDISDFLIVNLDLNTHPCGTLEEIFWANRQKKPILVKMEQGKHNAPDWLFGTLPHEFIFSHWDEMIVYLDQVNNTSSDYLNKRWCFFNLK